jgi:hypothetical protein
MVHVTIIVGCLPFSKSHISVPNGVDRTKKIASSLNGDILVVDDYLQFVGIGDKIH